MEFQTTKNRLTFHVELGHTASLTLICNCLFSFEADEHHTATAKSLEVDEQLLKAGFKYVTERDRIKTCPRRK
jgi:hypothetical protein